MLTRRHLLQTLLVGAGGLGVGSLWSCRPAAQAALADLAAEQAYDEGLQAYYPKACALRIVARSGRPPVGGAEAFPWHPAPDGGACFNLQDLGVAEAGWVYVSNSEMPDPVDRRSGGASALRFDGAGKVVAAYPILSGTRRNCAGGKTPWHSWLSCEEVERGLVYECDPLGRAAAVARPALGAFMHEAVACDRRSGYLYLTEDQPDGCLYRFKPGLSRRLDAGILEVAVQQDAASLGWRLLPDPSAHQQRCRYQVEGAARFASAEGIVVSAGQVYFATKGDDCVWHYDPQSGRCAVIYGARQQVSPVLSGVDNLEVAPGGEILVAEDGDNMQIAVLDKHNTAYPLLTLVGQQASEVCGLAFSPDGSRLYFSSQRGHSGSSQDGLTYELAFPFPL